MNIFLTVLSVIGITLAALVGFVLLLILILLPLRVRAAVKYDADDGFFLKAGLGPIMLTLFPMKKSKKKKPPKEEPEKEAEEEPAPQEEKTTEAKGFGAMIKALKFADYLDILEKAKTHFLSKIYFPKLHLRITVATPDAAKTAINYGKLTAAIFPLLGYLDSKKKIKDGDVHIHPDFTTAKSVYYLDTEICFRLFRAFHAGLAILIFIYKNGRRNNQCPKTNNTRSKA